MKSSFATIVVLGLSLVANAMLAARLVRVNSPAAPTTESHAVSTSPQPSATGDGIASDSPFAAKPQHSSTGTHGVRSLLEWKQIYSSDLPAALANLRAAGFSEALVRGAMSALVDERLESRRREMLGAIDDRPYWMPAVSPYYTPELM